MPENTVNKVPVNSKDEDETILYSDDKCRIVRDEKGACCLVLTTGNGQDDKDEGKFASKSPATSRLYWKNEWKPGEQAWFEYMCWESPESADAKLWYHSHQKVTVLGKAEADGWLKELSGMTPVQRLEEGSPRAYKIKFSDGFEYTAMEDELLTSQKGFCRPDPPKQGKLASKFPTPEGVTYKITKEPGPYPTFAVNAYLDGYQVGGITVAAINSYTKNNEEHYEYTQEKGTVRVMNVWVSTDLKYHGIGLTLYRMAIEEARKKGYKIFREGFTQSRDAKNVWARLAKDYRVVEENGVKHIELIPRPKTAALTRDNARWNGKPFSLGAVSLLDGHIEEAHNYQECKAGGWHHSHIFSQPILEREQSEYDWTKTDPRAPEGPQGGGPAIGWGDTPWGDSHGKTSGDIAIFWVEDDGSIGCNYPLPENIKAAINKQIKVIRRRRAAEEDTLAKLVWQFREEQEDWYEWLEDKSCFREQCLCLADLLAKFLREHGFPDAHRAGGYYGEGPEKGEHLQVGRHGLHWWVETQDKIIDITCDQFHPGEEDDWRVVITNLNDPEYQRKGTGSAVVPKTAAEIPEILYHVTFKSRVPKILQEGLVPQKEPNFPFEESRGLVFLTAIEGVDYWKNLLAEFIRGKDDELVTLRIKTEGLRLAKDPLGVGETGVPSYSTRFVPPKNITVLPEPRKIASVEQWEDKNVVAHVGSYRIVVDDPEDAEYITAWTEDNKCVGKLSTKRQSDSGPLNDYLGIGLVEVKPRHRGYGLGKAMYFALMQFMSPRWKGIKSYLPDRYNKKRVPNIWRRLQGYKLPGEEDWMVADRDKVAFISREASVTEAPIEKVSAGSGIRVIKRGTQLEAKHRLGYARGEITNLEGLEDWLDENGFSTDYDESDKVEGNENYRTFLLLAVEVNPAARRTGLGTALVDTVLQAARRAGAQDSYLHASPLDEVTEIETLYDFYGKLGFEPYVDSEYIMYKPLTGPQPTVKKAWQDERFSYWGLQFAVDKAEEFIAANPRPAQKAPKAFLEAFVGTVEDDKAEEEGRINLMNVGLNKEHMNEVDIEKPGIVAPLVYKPDKNHPEPQKHYILIDGNHRAKKRLQMGLDFMEVYPLTPEEAWQCMAPYTFPNLLKIYVNPTKKVRKKAEEQPARLLYVDDMRRPTASDVDWVRNYEEFVQYMTTHPMPEAISFDHDLALEHYPTYAEEEERYKSGTPPYERYQEKTGVDCIKWLKANNLIPQRWFVHSANDEGAGIMENMLLEMNPRGYDSSLYKTPHVNEEEQVYGGKIKGGFRVKAARRRVNPLLQPSGPWPERSGDWSKLSQNGGWISRDGRPLPMTHPYELHGEWAMAENLCGMDDWEVEEQGGEDYLGYAENLAMENGHLRVDRDAGQFSIQARNVTKSRRLITEALLMMPFQGEVTLEMGPHDHPNWSKSFTSTQDAADWLETL